MIALLFLLAAQSFAQGRIFVQNNCGVGNEGAILTVDSENPYLRSAGRDISIFNRRNRVDGEGYTSELWWAMGASADENSLKPIPGAQGHFFRLGHFSMPVITIPNTLGGDSVTVQVRFWDNRGGTIQDWAAVLADDTIPRATTGVIHDVGLAGLDAQGEPHLMNKNLGCTPELLAYIGLYIVPEPSVPHLMGIATLCAWFLSCCGSNPGLRGRSVHMCKGNKWMMNTPTVINDGLSDIDR